MPRAIAHRFRLLAPVALVPLVFVITALSTGGSASGSSPSMQTGRSAAMATASVGPHAVDALIAVKPYRVTLRITPNLARVHDHVSLTVSSHGRPVRATRVTVRYAMPAMNMQDLYDGQLARTGSGTYSAIEPVLGMPGTWQLRFVITTGKKPPVGVVVTDQMSAT